MLPASLESNTSLNEQATNQPSGLLPIFNDYTDPDVWTMGAFLWFSFISICLTRTRVLVAGGHHNHYTLQCTGYHSKVDLPGGNGSSRADLGRWTE